MILCRPFSRRGRGTVTLIVASTLLWGGCSGESADVRVCRAFELLGRAGAHPSEEVAVEAMRDIQAAGTPSDERIARVMRGATRLGNQIAVSGGALEELRDACRGLGITVPLPTGT